MTSKQYVSQILRAIPAEWHGTTFKNDHLLGREGFAKNLSDLLAKKEETKEEITTSDLENLGNAEDYLRVATNVATTLEFFLAREKGLSVDQVFTFGSTSMPVVAVTAISKSPVHLFVGDDSSSFHCELPKYLALVNGNITIHNETAPNDSNGDVVLALESAITEDSTVDGIVGANVLYIVNSEKISSADILVIRKRMATPATTPMAINMLQKFAGGEVTEMAAPSESDLNEFYAHLQTLSGTAVDNDVKPVVCTAGLSVIASLWMTLLSQGGADILMASTAYGGSSQLADILTSRSDILNKHTFDIQGIEAKLVERIQVRLDALAAEPEKLAPVTVLFVEVPTNPDMKVPDIQEIVPVLTSYKEKTGKRVVLLVDTTFAPGSGVMQKVREVEADLPVVVFISLSKSVSRGITTAGTIVANHTEESKALVTSVSKTASVFDTTAKNDQLQRLVDNHVGVEDRCARAYNAALTVGTSLREAVKEHCSYDMPLAFPTPEQAAIGFSSSTFSFNLPQPKDASDEVCQGLAQRFVDLLCEHKEFKPCVSFGQDNGLVYATVPATSTQGAIREEDKAKQAVGGVQLVRLSFAPSVDVDSVVKIVKDSVFTIYSQ